MPISDKIMQEISKSHTTEDEKKLMYNVLKIEDQGIFRFTVEYEKLIKAYIEDHKGEAGK